MTHKIECPTCAQHIILDLPDRGPLQLRQPVEVTMSSNTVLKLVIYLCLSIGLLAILGLAAVMILGAVLAF